MIIWARSERVGCQRRVRRRPAGSTDPAVDAATGGGRPPHPARQRPVQQPHRPFPVLGSTTRPLSVAHDSPVALRAARRPAVRHDGGMSARVRAPELRGRGWLNTGGRELTLADLRGKIVLLDFWTFCCINCLHVLDELRPLEEKYADVLVVDRGALAEVRAREGPGRAGRRRRAVRRAPPGARRPRAGHVAAVRGEGVAHPGGGRPRGLRGRHDGRRGPRRGAGPADRRADRHPRGQGHPAPGRRPVRAADAGRTRRCASPARPSLRDGGNLLVSDSARHSLVELAAGRRDAGPADRLRRAGPGRRAGRRGELLRAAGAVPAARARRRGRRLRPAWSPTPSTTCCAAYAWTPAR